MKLLKKRLPCLLVMILTLTALSACNIHSRESGGKIKVVATTTMLLDLSKQIGGDCVEASGLMGSGVDPHKYKATAGDISKMQEADVVLYSGLYLEGKMGDVLSSLEASGKRVICAADGISRELRIINDGVPDPHFWFDVSLWALAAKETAKGFIEADPPNEKNYSENLESYLSELESLDGYIRERVSEIPEEQRVLVTAHDAFGYFGRAYGFTVKGLQGINTVAEAGTSEVSRLADFIAENKIKAVFVESSLPVKSIEALIEAVRSRGFETSLGGSLFSDSTGDEKSGTDTYIAAFKHNADAIVTGLKGEEL
ncbi:MAG: zinc ABC transporter substrate-binding protein [Firmicutes bacterium]|nr:zinc ABC transporter substrate-binding protein [[Eubacterium] siraeum]MCM1487685.1 zinc ABC transporter substrate-binding protein [Bacillota bacterium]